jgi:translation initiation factor IF-2
MGFLDKAKAAATQAVQQGQAKVNAYQQGKSEGELYRALGEAMYKHHRQGGDAAAIDTAFAALDEHYAKVAQEAEAAAQAAAQAQAAAPAGAPAAAGAAPAAAPPATDAPAGNFTLDDM